MQFIDMLNGMNLMKSRFFRFCVICVIALVAVLLSLIGYCNHKVIGASEGRIYDNAAAVPRNRVALLLGTNPRGRNGHPNPYYLNRLAAAVELFAQGKVDRILISGDNSRKTYSEPEQMKEDLVAMGIPDSVIYLDYAGFRTLDSVVRAKEIFGQSRFTVISQHFHNERALYFARCYGIDAVAFDAGDVSSRGWRLRMKLRESLARVKAVWDVFIGKRPHFLGEAVVIE